MKLLLIFLSALLSSIAYADLAEVHQKNCEKSEVKELMGEKGSCRIVIAPKKFNGTASCTGIFMENFSCNVSYIAEDSVSALNIVCGDPTNPVMSQTMEATGLSYNVATMIKTSEGKDIIQNDEMDYKMIQSNALRVSIVESVTNIALTFPAGDIYLTDVKCSK